MITGKKILVAAIIPLLILSMNFLAPASAPPLTDYEGCYPQFVDSEAPLKEIRKKDMDAFLTALYDIGSYSIPLPITMPYGSADLQHLDIYRASTEGLNPIIFYIHGGASDKGQAIYALPSWLSLGYTVVSINYRSVPDSEFSEMVEDCYTALKWVLNHGHRFGGDPDNIAIIGFSCGAHLAALLVTDTKSQGKYGIDIRKVKCWIPISGFYDMELEENLISPVIANYIEWISAPSKKAASPAALATGNEPPCLIIHGGDDWCVPKTNAMSLFNRLNKDKTTLAILKGYMHMNIFFSYLNPGHEPARLIKAFLATHLPTPRNQIPKNES